MWEHVKKFFTYISDFFATAFDQLLLVIKSLVQTLFGMLKDIWFWIFDVTTDLVVEIVNGLGDLFSIDFNPAQYISGLPADVVNVIGVIRLGEALAIILGAIVIKIILQLIPFTRLGS